MNKAKIDPAALRAAFFAARAIEAKRIANDARKQAYVVSIRDASAYHYATRNRIVWA